MITNNMTLITNQLHQALAITFNQIYESKEEFPILLDDFCEWVGKSRTSDVRRDTLIKYYIEGQDYIENLCPGNLRGKGRGGSNRKFTYLSVNCFKHLCLRAKSPIANEIRQYFIDIENQHREPGLLEIRKLDIEEKRLELESRRLESEMKDRAIERWLSLPELVDRIDCSDEEGTHWRNQFLRNHANMVSLAISPVAQIEERENQGMLRNVYKQPGIMYDSLSLCRKYGINPKDSGILGKKLVKRYRLMKSKKPMQREIVYEGHQMDINVYTEEDLKFLGEICEEMATPKKKSNIFDFFRKTVLEDK
jgi:phage anti-repressor protein